MKIAIFDPYLDTMSGGEKYMLSIAMSLSKSHDVSIFWDESSISEIIDKASMRFGYDVSSITFVSSLFDKKISFLERFEASKQYDLIIVLSDGSIPVVASKLILHFQSPMNWVKGKSLKTQLKLTRVKKIIVNSKFTKEHIDKTFAKKSTVLYPPVSIQRKYDPQKKTKKILNVGRFGINQAGSSFKKQDILADTFLKMCDSGVTGWKLVFVMSVMDRDKDAFEDFKKKYTDYPITFLINPSNDILWDEYESASIYWHASGFGEDLQKYPDRAEHFGISTVEAMGIGAVPVVVAQGGQTEIIKDDSNGKLWTSLDELQQTTRDLINDKDYRERLARRGVEDAKGFSLSRFESQINELVL